MQWNLELNLSNGSHLFSPHPNWTKIQIRAGADWGGVWRLIGVQLWTVARWPLQMRRHQSPINLIKPLRWPESHNTTVNVLSLSKAIALMVQCAFLKMRFFSFNILSGWPCIYEHRCMTMTTTMMIVVQWWQWRHHSYFYIPLLCIRWGRWWSWCQRLVAPPPPLLLLHSAVVVVVVVHPS